MDPFVTLEADAVAIYRDEQACKHASLDLTSNIRKTVRSCPFLQLSNTASSLIRDIKVWIQLESLGQIFARPLSLSVNSVDTPLTIHVKYPRSRLTNSEDTKN
eukprot:13370374-Ditylum_brightwellii.AAC.1